MVAAPLSRARISQHGQSRSFAAYMQHRPAPLDGIERALLRLDWLRWRLWR